MAQITLKQLEAFVQVADLASFRRAAERLNTTQPNISARISGLETQLGVTLMERDAGSVRLTPVGVTLLEKARDVLRRMDDFLVAAGEDHLFDGVLRLGVTELIVHTWLGPYLRALKTRFPNLDVDLTVDFSANVTNLLFSRTIDLALQSEPFGRQISGSEPLGAYPFVWVAAPTLGLQNTSVTLAAMAPHAILTHARGTLPFEQLNAHIAQTPDRVRLVPSTNLVACLQMTRDGLGVACLPHAMLRPDLESGALVELDYPWVPDPLAFFARFDAQTVPAYVAEAAKLAHAVAADNQYL